MRAYDIPYIITMAFSSVKWTLLRAVNLYFLRFQSMGNVVSQLSDDGYEQVTGDEEPEGMRYMVDSRCTDLLCFAGDQRYFLEEHTLIKSGHIVIQVRELRELFSGVEACFTTPLFVKYGVCESLADGSRCEFP